MPRPCPARRPVESSPSWDTVTPVLRLAVGHTTRRAPVARTIRHPIETAGFVSTPHRGESSALTSPVGTSQKLDAWPGIGARPPRLPAARVGLLYLFRAHCRCGPPPDPRRRRKLDEIVSRGLRPRHRGNPV